MAYIHTAKHGFKFLIDTMDWQDHDDAEKCAVAMDAAMDAWSPEDTSRYHALLIRAVHDDIDLDDPALEPVREIGNDAATAILSEYASWPDVGHNASIGAVFMTPAEFKQARLTLG